MIFRLTALFYFLTLFAFPALSQDFSNKGKDFWVGYGSHVSMYNSSGSLNASGGSQDMVLYFTADQPTVVTVSIPATGWTRTYNVVPNTVTESAVIPKTGTDDSRLATEGVSTKAIHVTSDKPIVAYQHIYNSSISGATLLFPTNTLGQDYYVLGFTQLSNSAYSYPFCFVIATENNTLVEVTPAANTLTHAAGVPFTQLLQKGEVLNLLGQLTGGTGSSFTGVDLTGTRIRSVSTGGGCKKIAVFCGTGKINIRCNTAAGTSSADNTIQQCFPASAWGKKYITVPTKDMPNNFFRIMVNDATTVVKVNGVRITNLTGNRYYEFQANTANVIEADKAIMVAQFITTANQCGNTALGSNGDPEMIYLSPVEQTINRVTVNSTRYFQINAANHYINVAIKTAGKASFTLDGVNRSASFAPVAGDPNFSFAQFQTTVGIHNLSCDSGFNAIAYGFGSAESYGYNAGSNVIDLYQFVTLQNEFASVNFPATCKNTPFKFAITLPYQATSLSWDFGANANLTPNATVVNNAPVPDSIFTRDNRLLYLYKLTGNYMFSNPGTYPIKVIANNPSADGCSGIQEISYDVEVYNGPSANFKISHTGCVTDSVMFTDSTNGNGRTVSKWLWNFGNNKTDTLKNPVHLYSNAGNYNVTLRVISDIGCISDTAKPIIISSKPKAVFGSKGPYCPNSTISFGDTSTITIGSIVKWYWNFGNGNTLVATNNTAPPQTYPTAGTYTVTLQVESNTGCKSIVQEKQLIIHPLPNVDFNLPGVCLPSGIAQFQNLSSVTNGSLLTYVWNFGDGGTDTVKNPIHVYTAPGPYNVMLQATSAFGCVKDSIKTFSNIFAQPKAAFTISSPQICVSDSVFFTDGSSALNNTITQWFWDFGDGTTSNDQNPRKKYAAGNSYVVKLYTKSAAGCISDTAQKTIIVYNLPVAIFTTSAPLCETRTVTLASQSTSTSGSINAWYWNLGDGTTSTVGSSPITNIYAPGTYTIKLAVESDKGCKSDTAFKTIIINALPQVNFILPVVCLSDAFANFTDSSFINDTTGSSFSYAWNFNDPNASASNPNTSTLKNPQHKFSASGVYNIRLTVTSNKGCANTVIKPFTVNGAVPDAQFDVLDATSLCSNIAVRIQNKSVVDFGSVSRLEIIWDNVNAPTIVQADGAPTFDKIYAHNYPSLQVQATYRIKIRAFSGGTCVDELIKSVLVQPSPKVVFSTIPGICLDAVPRQINQPLNGNVPGFGIFSGSGVSGAGIFNPAITGAGNHLIRYTYTSNTGCKDSAEALIKVWPSPTAVWNYSSPTCVGNSILFSDSSIANAGNITSWNWNFAGTPDNRPNANPFTYSFNSTGSKAVSLQVITDSGCKSAIVTKNVEVHPKPQVAFSLPLVCLPAGKAQFNDLSTIAGNPTPQFSYVWSFGDANSSTSNLKDPIFNYSSLGPFNIKLQVTSGFGCIDSLSQLLTTIYPQPKAGFSFSPSDTCLGGNIYFSDSSKSVSGPITDWYWNFGDGSTGGTPFPTKRYTAARSYSISLHIKNQQGCLSDTVTKQLTIHPYPVVNAGPDLFVLEGDQVALQPQATGNDLRYLWTPSIYLNNDTVKNPVSKPLADVTYKLTVTGKGSCKAEDAVFIKLLKSLGIPNAFSPNGDGVNDRFVIQYLENYPGATVEIFDRFGQQVHMSYGYKTPWDGTFNGNPLPIGTYYYIINPKNGRTKYSGPVTILK